MAKFYQYPNCSTCKKAQKWLDARGIKLDSVHIVNAPPPLADLQRVFSLSGLPINKLFNTSGVSYREGGFKEKLTSMTEAKALQALAADGKLIKRPLVLGSDFALVGFSEAAYQRQFA